MQRLLTSTALVLVLTSPLLAQPNPEIGPDDFQIDPLENPDVRAYGAAVGYSPDQNRFLIVWEQEENPDSAVLGRFLDSAGTPVGDVLSIYDAEPMVEYFRFAVTYDPLRARFLVTFHHGDLPGLVAVTVETDGTVGTASEVVDDCALPDCTYDVAFNSAVGEYLLAYWRNDVDPTIFGRRLNADGLPLGVGELNLASGSTSYPAEVSVAYNPDLGQYLLVWKEATFQRLLARPFLSDASAAGAAQVLTDINPAGEPRQVDSGYDAATGSYLVVWNRSHQTATGVDREIAARRLAADGLPAGPIESVSRMGRNNDLQAGVPKLDMNPAQSQSLVTWNGYASVQGVDIEFEMFGRYLSDGVPLDEQFRFSDLGPPEDPAYDTYQGGIAFASVVGHYLAVFTGDAAPEGRYNAVGQFLHGAPVLFGDGFESGDTMRWDSTTP